MKLEIIGKNENKAMQRDELVMEASDTKLSPSRKELKPKIAAMVNAKEETVVIESIKHKFGSRQATIKANIYKNPEALKAAGQKHLVERDSGKKKKKEEKPKEATKPEQGKPEGKPGQKPEAKGPEGKPGQKPEAKGPEGKEGQKPEAKGPEGKEGQKPEAKQGQQPAEKKEEPADEKKESAAEKQEPADEKKEGGK